MPNIATGARDFDSRYLTEAAFTRMKVTSSTRAPAFSRHMRTVSSLPGIIKVADKATGSVSVALQSAYTAGSGTMTFSAITLFNNYAKELVPGYTEIQVPLGATYRLTAYDPVTRIASVSLLFGTDVSLAANRVVTFSRHNMRGDIANAGEDSQFGNADFNYTSYFNFRFSIADDLTNNKLQLDINEYTLDNQIQQNLPAAYKIFENKIWFDTRSAGDLSAVVTRTPDGTNQGGRASRAGGIIPLARARGLYEVNLAGAPISANLFSDLTLRLGQERGAWGSPTDLQSDLDRASGTKNAIVYCDPAMINEPSKLAALLGDRTAMFDVSDKVDGVLGVKTRKIMGDDVLYSFIGTDAFIGSRAMYIVTDLSDIDVQVLYFMNDTELAKRGTFTDTMAENAFTVGVTCPWRHALLTNVGAL